MDFDEKIVKLKELIEKAEDIIILAHVNPDGDAIGSSLGLYHSLKQVGKTAKVIVPNDFPVFLKWLPGAENILNYEKNKELVSELMQKANLIFYCDFNDPKRISNVQKSEQLSKAKKVMIDHHPQPVNFANVIFSETSVSSTAELMYEIIRNLYKETPISAETANCLLTGIITDTGLFHHNSERPRTLEIAANLISAGADKAKIIDEVYSKFSFGRIQLLGLSINQAIRYHPELSAAFIYLSKKDLKKYNHQIGDTEGFVNYPLSINGVQVSALFIEKDDHVKVSLRSKDSFDVNELARKHFHGGGHKNAAGGKYYHSLNKTVKDFVSMLQNYKDELNKN